MNTPTPIHRQNRVLELLKLIRPWTMRRQPKIRLGNAYDGGYVVPAIALEADGVMSVGVGPDVSFDFALAQRGAKIVQFDHTVEKPPTDHPAFSFFKLGWGTRTEGDLLSFDDMLAKLDALGSKRPLLKFDIEGAEYDVFSTVTPEHLARFEVICCELHDFEKLGDEAFFAQAQHLLKMLNAGHVPVHLHANNYQSLLLVEGVPVPRVIELCFLRRDLDSFPNFSVDPIPGPLDRPNHPMRPDLCLNPF
ncbi:MAG: FkbM family methyltransferase [Vitreoscilla sp.]|nr:FkbM family methyltransferase [Burkholderiales bacterium]MBP6336864.1 FkbM family methyltransferase [Vitreoscilla sp.]MBP6674668.1 FkbM family methyltransferase [Vitreoscilla sp.]